MAADEDDSRSSLGEQREIQPKRWGGWARRNCGEMKPRKDYHKNHSKADELEDVCKPCKAVRDAARRRSRATVCATPSTSPILACPPVLCFST